MTKRTLVRRLVVACSFALLACGVPKKYIADRDHLNAAIEAFTLASQQVSDANGGSGPTMMTPALSQTLETTLSRGLASADSVGDPFLEWLHPEMPRQFRDNLVAGQRLLLEAIRNEDSARIARAEQLLVQWEQFYNTNVEELSKKANP